MNMELAKYLYNDLIATDYRGNMRLDIPDNYFVDEILCNWDENCKREEYDEIIQAFEKILEDGNIKIYEGNLQLSENHTLLKLNNDVDIDMIEWMFQVDHSLQDLEEETGVEFFYDGRMNRHIVVKNTVEHFLRALELRERLLSYEQGLVDYVNDNYKKTEEEEE